MAKIRFRTTRKQQDAIKREIKRLIDDNLIGTGPKRFMPNKVCKKVQAQRGTKGLPGFITDKMVWYYFNQLRQDGEIFIKEDGEGEAYLVTKEKPNRLLSEVKEAELAREKEQTNNNKEEEVEKTMTKINVIDANDKKKDEKFARIVENKIQKSIRNTREFKNALNRALMGGYDEDIDDATGQDFLKVTERWSIRKIFSIELGDDYYKLYKEVYYIEDPHKYYFEEVNPTIYRRLAAQHEEGDRKWAEAVAKHENIAIVED